MPRPASTLDKFAAMRTIDERTSYHRKRSQELYPPQGTIGVGSQDFDHLLKAVVGEAYLRALRKGKPPTEAHLESVKEGNDCVERWNKSMSNTRASINGPYELKRWDKSGESEADSLHVYFLNLLRS